jgi:hypothetical protein
MSKRLRILPADVQSVPGQTVVPGSTIISVGQVHNGVITTDYYGVLPPDGVITLKEPQDDGAESTAGVWFIIHGKGKYKVYADFSYVTPEEQALIRSVPPTM